MKRNQYMVFILSGCRHMVIGYATTVEKAREYISKDFGVPVEDVIYAFPLDTFLNASA